MKKNNYKKQEGVTIIALTVTIIVLLILAGVTISIITGDNPIIGKSEESRRETEIMQYQDKLEVLKQLEYMNNYTADIEQFIANYVEIIEKDAMFNPNKGIIPDVENSLVTVITKEGYKFEVTIDDVIYVGNEGESNNDDIININDVRLTILSTPTEWTNGKVKVRISSNTSKVEKQYSIDGGVNWKKYEGQFEIQDNGTEIQARAINSKNEITKVVTKKIDNIDRLAPNNFEIKTLTTTNSITVSGQATDQEATTKDGKSDIKGYKFSKDNGVNWTDLKLEGKYTFEDLKLGNTYPIKVMAIDNAGNETMTNTTNVTVEEEIVVPDGNGKIKFAKEPTGWTRGPVKVTISTEEIGYGIEYSLDETRTYATYNAPVEIRENMTIYARLTKNGKAGKSAPYTIDNIDLIAPTKPAITNSSEGKLTNKDVEVTVSSQDTQSGIDHYEWFENDGWTTRALTTTNGVGKITFSADRNNLTIRFRAIDKVGNISEEATTVVNLDKTAPVISSIKNSSNGNWTNQKIDLSWSITENGSGIQKVQYSYNGSQWTGELGKEEWYGLSRDYERNDILYIRAIDEAGNISNVSSTNMKIDKTIPTVELEKNGGTYIIPSEKSEEPITTKITAQDGGGSGLKNLQYQISSSPTIPADNDANWKNFTNGSSITENKSEGTWYLYTKVTDNAGNRATHIQKSNPYVVKYSVSYNANGGKGTMPTDAISYNAPYTTRENTFTRVGHTFIGWNEKADGSGVDWTDRIAKPWNYTYNKSITLYAQWKVNQYTLTVNPNGGKWNNTAANSTFIQNYGTTKTIANPIAPAGYRVTFNGNGGNTPTAQTSTKSFTNWTNAGAGTLSGTTYTFGAGNGTLTANYRNNSITLPTSTRANYKFLGWYTAATGGTKIGNAGAAYTPTGAIILYAQWKANPSVNITKQPVNQTVVAGNKFSFDITAIGSGTLSYQWYYSADSKSPSNWQPGSTSRTYTSTSNTGLNGRYIYCKVTATLDGVSVSENSNTVRLTVQTANYSTLKNNVTTYYNTLQQAIAGATSGGGDTGGGTITVLISNTDTSEAVTNKTIRINTNGKTVTRNKYINTTGGTLTIDGGGMINNNNTDDVNAARAVAGRGGNITIKDAELRAENNAISMSTGNLNIESGSFYGKQGDAITYGGQNGQVTIDNAHIYSPKSNTHAIGLRDGNYDVKISDSWIGNASSKQFSKFVKEKEAFATISNFSTGTTTITGESRIYSGPYGAATITKYNGGTLKLLGNSYLYATNEGDDVSPNGRTCVNVHDSGAKITFDSSGNFFATGYFVGGTEPKATATYTIKRGEFASRHHKYMFASEKGKADTKYTGELKSGTKGKNYYWMTSLDVRENKKLDCYYFSKGDVSDPK